ncbi:MAG: DUF1127 domain-containing protein [Pseudomonadota bacterium]
MVFAALLNPLARLFGVGREARARSDAYVELMGLSDRELADIGLTRGLVETVIWQGPEAIAHLLPEGAVRTNIEGGVNRNDKLTSGAA